MSESPEFRGPTVPEAGGEEDREPSRALRVELATRVFVESLHFRSGDEATAARSIVTLFEGARELLKKHPRAAAFEAVTLVLLNRVVRRNTARWHRWIEDGAFANELPRRRFRRELQVLQSHVAPFFAAFDALSRGEAIPSEALERIRKRAGTTGAAADLGPALPARLSTLVSFSQSTVAGRVVRVGDVEAAEHREILARRRLLGVSRPGDGAGDAGPLMDATALCLSGGGIRSATFCLGAVQALARRGLLPQIDYLGTVSGGGYLGSFLTCFLGTHRESVAKAAGASVTVPAPSAGEARARLTRELLSDAGTEAAGIRHLRNNSKYLLNGGLWGRLMIFGLLAGGVALNILLILPWPVLAGVTLAALAHWGFWGGAGLVGADPASWAAGWGTGAGAILMVAAVVFGVAWFFLPAVGSLTFGAKPFTAKAQTRVLWESGTLLAALAALGALAVYAVPAIVATWRALWVWVEGRWMAHGESWLVVVSGLAPLVLGPLGAEVCRGESTWWRRLARRAVPVLFVLSGPLFYFLAGLWTLERLTRDEAGEKWIVPAALGTVALAVWGWGFVNVNSLSPHRYYRARLCECYLAMRGMDQSGWVRRWWRKWWRGNESPDGSAHRGLLPAERRDELGTLQHVPLSSTGTTGAAPYHILQAAVNLPASNDRNLRGRDCDFFIFSRNYCGSPVTGYVATTRLEQLDPHLDLGTAMAISAAAASSNMGIKSLRQYRFLISLFNVRLGYWLPHPAAEKAVRPGATYLLREMAGRLNEAAPLVNVSDGGHIENLALYEMLRRRCRFVICIDAGQEPGMECTDLFAVQRYAAIDLGVTLEFDVADLCRNATGFSRSPAVLGKIHYPAVNEPGRALPAGQGWFVFLKLAVTGAEAGYVADYRRREPEFPHQSTGDQLYDEAQFEAYRALGESAMESLFRDELRDGLPPALRCDVEPDPDGTWRPPIETWMRVLATNLLPDNDESFREI